MSSNPSDALRNVVRTIKLRDNYVLGVKDLTTFSISPRSNPRLLGKNSELQFYNPETRRATPFWDNALCSLERLFTTELGRAVTNIDAATSIDTDLQEAVIANHRSSKYALLPWRNSIAQVRLVILDLSGLSQPLFEIVGLMTDGIVAIVDQVAAEQQKFVEQTSRHGLPWVGYWTLKPINVPTRGVENASKKLAA